MNQVANPVQKAMLSTHGARAAVRLSDEYFLRALRIIAELTGADMVTAIVFRAVVAGNIGYLEGQESEAALYADLDTVPPDHLRRPVSILSVSGTLGLPYETTRRHVRKLIASGFCRMERGGVIAPAERLVGPAEEAAILANLANLRRLFRGLKRAGVDLE